MKYKVLALDLEGTLISNAVSLFVRPHLFQFLEFCSNHFERIVIFSSVTRRKVIDIQKFLTEEHSVPPWFKNLEVIDWRAEQKDLRFIKNSNSQEVLIIDDQESYILDEQKQQWIKVQEWLPPFEQSLDDELIKIQDIILSRLK